MVDQDLARISEGLVYSAMLVYTGAFGAFAYDLSLRGKLAAARPVREPVGVTVGAVGDDRAAGPTGPTVPAAGTTGRSKAVGIAVALTVLAFGLHAGGVAARGLSAGRAPWGNMY